MHLFSLTVQVDLIDHFHQLLFSWFLSQWPHDIPQLFGGDDSVSISVKKRECLFELYRQVKYKIRVRRECLMWMYASSLESTMPRKGKDCLQCCVMCEKAGTLNLPNVPSKYSVCLSAYLSIGAFYRSIHINHHCRCLPESRWKLTFFFD